MSSFVPKSLLLLSVLYISCFSLATSSSILGIFPAFSKSHYIFASALMKGLAESGHNVTVISPFQLAKPMQNFREIMIQGVQHVVQDQGYSTIADLNDLTALESAVQYQRFGLLIANYTLKHPVMREFIANPTNEHFDAVIVEANSFDAMLGLGQHFGAPVIGLGTTGATLWSADLVGTPAPMSIVPNLYLPFTDSMSFAQRVVNIAVSGIEWIAYQSHLRDQARLYDEVFAADVHRPPLNAVRRNVSLVLLNQHHTLSYPRPYVPNMIEVGGLHVNRQAARELPEDIRQFVEGAEHGVIYFSLGSNVLSKELSAEVRDGLLRVFAELRERVLWKWEDEELPGKPANVLVRKWFPQDDVLAHRRVKLFITHGGLLSSTEAVYHGVPIVGVPVFYDQFLNMAQAEQRGWGVTIAFRNLTEASMRWALAEALGSEKYGLAAKELSRRYRDQPMEPLQTAIYWVEYVIRNGGAGHMRSAGQDLSVVQYHNVDVFAFLAFVLGVVLYLMRWGLSRLVEGVGLGTGGQQIKATKQKKN